jgi:hypothetical protein
MCRPRMEIDDIDRLTVVHGLRAETCTGIGHARIGGSDDKAVGLCVARPSCECSRKTVHVQWYGRECTRGCVRARGTLI